MHFSRFVFPLFVRRVSVLLAGLVAMVAAPEAKAYDDNPIYEIRYSEPAKPVQGDAPFNYSYDLYFATPAAFPLGVRQLTVNATVVTAPAGVSPALAASYISISPSTVTVSGPAQLGMVTVRLSIPVGTESGDFSYLITLGGIPAGLGLIDRGAYVNMHINPPSGLEPPAVSIDTPPNGTTYTHVLGGPDVEVPIKVSAAANNNAPVLTLKAYLKGRTTSGTQFLPETELPIVLNGLGTPSAMGSIAKFLAIPGIYTIRAEATNSVGLRETTSEFEVVQTYPAPTVVIHTPLPGSEYIHYLGKAPAVVPFKFTGTSLFGGITSLTATMDGNPVTFTPAGLNTLVATGSVNLNFTTAGTHELKVIARNDYGVAEAITRFSVRVISPVPTIVINDPDQNEVFQHVVGTPDLDIPFEFVTTTSANFTVDWVGAELDGQPIAIASTTGLGTVSAVSVGTMEGVPAGQHTLVARGLSSGIPVETSVTFTVVEVQPTVPPSVVINTPAEGTTYTIQQGSSQTVNLTFTGTSNYPGGVITGMTAALNGVPLNVSYTTSGKYGYGTATFTVSQPGTHVITVTATDAVGTAEDVGTFKVNVIAPTTQRVCGTVFFDVNFNGKRDNDEFGLDGVTVKLINANGTVIKTTTTNSCGQYTFSSVLSGYYEVHAVAPTGLAATTLNELSINVQNWSVTVPNIGFGLKFDAIRSLTANGFTIGFWKNNLDKALSCKSKGAQISKQTLQCYTAKIGSLALDPFKCISMSEATSIMGKRTSVPSELLAKQLLASEYNYANGAYIGGSKTLTYCFIYWGEYVLKNKHGYSSSYILFAKDWFDAYNNSHGGLVRGPGY